MTSGMRPVVCSYSQPYWDNAGLGLMVGMSAPVFDGDKFIGVVGVARSFFLGMA